MSATASRIAQGVPAQELSHWALQRPCEPWKGRPSEYQGEAKAAIHQRLEGSGAGIPWIYVTPRCGTKLCLQPMHIKWFSAQRLAYPQYVCVYCGLPGYTKDHLLPRTMTGDALRRFVAVVPACLECNIIIGDRADHRVTARREMAHEGIRKKHRKLIESEKRWTPDELAELGPNLRTAVQSQLDQAEVVAQRLAWPWDPDFDTRAFEKSGFDDPIAMDLI